MSATAPFDLLPHLERARGPEVDAPGELGPVAVAAAAALLEALGLQAEEGEPPLPRVDDATCLTARWALSQTEMPWWCREEAMALVRHGWIALCPEVGTSPLPWLLYLSSRLDPTLLVALLRCGWGGQRWPELADRLELALIDTHTCAPAADPLVGEDVLSEDTADGARVANELRMLRLDGVVSDPWAMWARLSMHTRERARPELVLRVALPGAPPVELAALGIQVDLELRMEDLRGDVAQRRRQQAAQRVGHALERGRSVAWLANSSSIESRQSFVSLARAHGARVRVVMDGSDPSALRGELAAAGWELEERTFERGLTALAGPRPHEAEQVLVVRGGRVVERWLGTVRRGWRVTPE